VRALQLDLRNQFLKDAASRVQRLREKKKEYWDNTKEIQRHEFRPGELVLLQDSVREIDMSSARKLDARWLGPYRISSKNSSQPERGTYWLEDLDGTQFAHTTPGWRLKVFRQRDEEDIREEERGTSKLWNPHLWESEAIIRPPPAQFDDSNVVESPVRSKPDDAPRDHNLRSLPSRDPANTTKLVHAEPSRKQTVQLPLRPY
jgi:hypothetical protein